MDTGDTAWLLTSSALVLLMIPGLALFYGGMVRSKNLLAMLMKNVVAMGVVSITCIVICYWLAFSGDAWGWGWWIAAWGGVVVVGGVGLPMERSSSSGCGVAVGVGVNVFIP